MDNTHEWCAPGVRPQIDILQDIPLEALPWWTAKIQHGETIHISDVKALPAVASAERELLEEQQIKSVIALPMIYRGAALGFLGFDAVRAKKEWPEESIRLLRIVGEILVDALQRKRAEDELRLSYQTLEHRVADRTRELSVLLEASHNLVSTLELQPLLGLILEQLEGGRRL